MKKNFLFEVDGKRLDGEILVFYDTFAFKVLPGFKVVFAITSCFTFWVILKFVFSLKILFYRYILEVHTGSSEVVPFPNGKFRLQF